MTICYHAPTTVSAILGVIIMFGTFVSYCPQYISIYRSASSEGLSHLALCFGLLSGLLTVLDTMILYWGRITCCFDLSATECLLNNLVPVQVSLGPLCVLVLYGFYFYYFSPHPGVNQSKEERLHDYLMALVEFGATLIGIIFLSVAAMVMHFAKLVPTEVVLMFGRVVGMLSAVVVLLHWTPQLWYTFKLSKAGCLSLPMLLLQCPGAFMVVGFQLSSPDPDWSTWAPMLVSGSEQFILLIMLIYFLIRDRNKNSVENILLIN